MNIKTAKEPVPLLPGVWVPRADDNVGIQKKVFILKTYDVNGCGHLSVDRKHEKCFFEVFFALSFFLDTRSYTRDTISSFMCGNARQKKNLST